MDGFDVFILDFLRHTAGVSESMLTWLYPLTAAFAVALFSYVCTAVFRFIVMPAVQKLTERTKAKWDDYIFNHRVMKAFRRIIPPVIWYVALPLVLTHSPGLLSFLLKVCNIYLVVVSLLFVSAFSIRSTKYPRSTKSCATVLSRACSRCSTCWRSSSVLYLS